MPTPKNTAKTTGKNAPQSKQDAPHSKRKGRGRGKARTDAATISVKEKHAEWLRLRKMGLSFQDIADQYHTHASTVHNAVKRTLAKLTLEPAEDVVKTELARLDDIIASNYPAMLAGRISAANIIIKAMQRRSKLLGLDAPEQIHHSGAVDTGHDWRKETEAILDNPDARAQIAATAAEISKRRNQTVKGVEDHGDKEGDNEES